MTTKNKQFYLKNKKTGLYLYRSDEINLDEQNYCTDRNNQPLDYCLFSQDEINTLESIKYNQIEVK